MPIHNQFATVPRMVAAMCMCWACRNQAPAETVRWINPNGGSFFTASNWDPAGAPGAADVALFELRDDYAITFPRRPRDNDPTVRAVYVADDLVSFELNDRTFTLTDGGANPSLRLGFSTRPDRGNHGRLTLSDGAMVGVDAVLGESGAVPLALRNHGELIISVNATLDLSGGINVGQNARGTLRIEQGGQAMAPLLIGVEAAGDGRAVISDAGSLLNSSVPIIGAAGAADLTIAAGGGMESTGGGYIGRFAGSEGGVEVVGSGSYWHAIGSSFVVGDAGSGAIQVHDAGKWLSGGTTTIGKAAGGSGEVLVSGIDSSWQNTSVIVGAQGVGKVTIAAGAKVTTVNSATLGLNSNGDGVAVIQGTGSEWTIDVSVAVGDSGHGILSVLDGGAFRARELLVGARLNAPGSGEARVDGAGSRIEFAEQLVVGGGGGAGQREGQLTVTAGGLVENLVGLLASNSTATGEALVDGPGSTWQNLDSLHVGGSAAGPGGQATLDVTNGGLVSAANALTIWDAGQLRLDGGRIESPMVAISGGRLTGEGTITGDVFSSGTVKVGDEIGRLVVAGDYEQNFAGRIQFEIAGADVGQYDVLQVDGQVDFGGGNIDVMFLDGFLPRAGDVFNLFDFASATGAPGGIQLPALAEGLSWRTIDLTSRGEFAVIVDILGDTNDDGKVDLEDLNNVRNNFGQMSMPILGDTDDDNDVDLGDLNNVRNNFGATGSPDHAVPEPTSILMLVAGTSALVGLRGPRRRRASF